MATTTVAAGKIRNKANENLCRRCLGWLVMANGRLQHRSAREVSKGGFMTPLGGTPEGSSYGGRWPVWPWSTSVVGSVRRHHGTDLEHTGPSGTAGYRHIFHAGARPRPVPRSPPNSGTRSPPSATRCAQPSGLNCQPVMVAGDPGGAARRRYGSERSASWSARPTCSP